jgi:CRP-like cAMP-binding protein
MTTESAKKAQGLMHIQNILRIMEEKNFKTGEYIFKEGDEDNNFYLVLHGEIEISKKTSEGQSKVIAQLKQGEILGEGVLSGIMVKPATAQAVSDVTLLALSTNDFEGLLSRNPRDGADFLLSVLQTLNERLNRANVKLIALYEINKLMDVYRDDLNNLASALTQKLLAITESKDGIFLIKNPFADTYRVLYKTSDSIDENTFLGFEKQKSRIVTNGKYQYLFVDLKGTGFLVLRRKISDAAYEDDHLRLLILIAEQAGNTIQSAARRASDKARNILQQKKFIL